MSLEVSLGAVLAFLGLLAILYALSLVGGKRRSNYEILFTLGLGLLLIGIGLLLGITITLSLSASYVTGVVIIVIGAVLLGLGIRSKERYFYYNLLVVNA